jgi:hypothetical protein
MNRDDPYHPENPQILRILMLTVVNDEHLTIRRAKNQAGAPLAATGQ